MKITRNQFISWSSALIAALVSTIAVSRGVSCYQTLLTPANCIITAIVTIIFMGFLNYFIQSSIHPTKETLTNFAVTIPLISMVVFGMIIVGGKKEICSAIPDPDTREVRTEYQDYYIWQLGFWTIKDTCTEEPTQ